MKNSTALAPDLGLLMIRVMLGVVFLYHGAQKLFGAFDGSGLEGFAGFLGPEGLDVPMPMVAAVCAALAEFVGGIALITGIFMRPIILTTVFTMLVAAFKAHGDAFSLQNGGMEYALTLAVVTAGVFFTGAGKLALPTPKIGRRRDD